MRAVAAIALVCAFQALTAVALYERPINADCIQLGSGTGEVDLYPARYQIIGDEASEGETFTTEASARERPVTSHHRRRPCAPAALPCSAGGHLPLLNAHLVATRLCPQHSCAKDKVTRTWEDAFARRRPTASEPAPLLTTKSLSALIAPAAGHFGPRLHRHLLPHLQGKAYAS